jgi:hypothetical protein
MGKEILGRIFPHPYMAGMISPMMKHGQGSSSICLSIYIRQEFTFQE